MTLDLYGIFGILVHLDTIYDEVWRSRSQVQVTGKNAAKAVGATSSGDFSSLNNFYKRRQFDEQWDKKLKC